MTSTASLEAFFGAWGALLRGEIDPAGLEARIGPSPSGTEAVAFCQRLYHHHRSTTLRALFPTVAAHLSDATWTALVAAYADAHPATGSQQRDWGRPFPVWLAAWERLPEDHRAPLAELALLAEARRTARFAATERDRLQLVALRHDAPAADRATRAGTPTMPRPAPRLLLVFRHRTDGAVRELSLDGEGLAAVLEARGDPLPRGLSEAPPDARARLIAAGALGAGQT